MRFLIDADLPRSASDVVRRRACPPEQYAGIVVLNLPRTATAACINRLPDSFLEQEAVLAQLSGKLAIVEPGRIRLRS